jgi:hypothetical protein
MTEAQITRHVIERWRTLGLPRTLVASIPNMGARGQYGLTPGLPDLVCVAPKFVGFIELKTEKGRTSKHQEAFQVLCEANDIPCAVTYGLDQAIATMERWNLIRRTS